MGAGGGKKRPHGEGVRKERGGRKGRRKEK